MLASAATECTRASTAATWSPANAGLPIDISSHIEALTIDPGNSATLYAGTNHGVYKSNDGGANWTAFNTGFSGTVIVNALAVSPAFHHTLYAGATGGVFYQRFIPAD